MLTKVPTSTMTTSAVSLKFECVGAEQPSLTLFNSFKCWPLNIPFDPSPSGQGAHHFSLCHIWQLAAWALGVGWGSGPLGAATRCPRRRRPFHFFSRLGLFWRFGTFGFWASRRTTDGRTDETGLTPDPPSSNGKSPKFYRQIFFWRF